MRETKKTFPWTSPLVEQDVINKLHDLFRGENSGLSFEDRLKGIQQLVMSGGDDQPEEMSAEWVRTRDLPLHMTEGIKTIECFRPGKCALVTCFLVRGLYCSQGTRAEKEESHDAFDAMWFVLFITGLALVDRCTAKHSLGRNIAQTESQACVVLRSRLSSLVKKLRKQGDEDQAELVDKIANANFTTFSMITDIEKTALVKGVGPVLGQTRGGGGGGEVVLDVGAGEESMPLLKTEDTSSKGACCIM